MTSLTVGSANTRIPKCPPSIRSRPPWLWTTPPSLSRILDSIPMANGTERRPQASSSPRHTTSSTAKSAWTSLHPPPAHFPQTATGLGKSRLASSPIPVTWSLKGTNYLFSNSNVTFISTDARHLNYWVWNVEMSDCRVTRCYHVYHFLCCRDSVEVKVPAKKETSKESFSPSGWHVYRNKVAETGTRSSVYNVQVGVKMTIDSGRMQ